MPSLGALPMMSNAAPKKAGSRWSNDCTSIIPDIVEPEPLLTRRLTRLSKQQYIRQLGDLIRVIALTKINDLLLSEVASGSAGGV
jgi:hypothetical protein